MKKKKFILVFICILFAGKFCEAQISKYRTIDEDGIANTVFSNNAIALGREADHNLKSVFNSTESIYTRCYFPKAFGNYNVLSKEQFVIDVWVNGRFVERKNMLNPDADWDQIQVYLLNTGDDDFNRLSGHIQGLTSGEHTLMLSVGVERFLDTKKVVNDDGRIIEEDIFNLLVLSKGEIKIILN